MIGFEPNGAMIDIGVKSSAYCACSEAALVKPTDPAEVFELGASYEFTVASREDENGQLLLSRRKLLFERAWEEVAKQMADDEVMGAHGQTD